jgi:hypothetical protein
MTAPAQDNSPRYQYAPILVAPLLLVLAIGAGVALMGQPEPTLEIPPQPVPELIPIDPFHGPWAECDRGDAEWKVGLQLFLTDGTSFHRTMYICHQDRCGKVQRYGSGFFCAGGENGGQNGRFGIGSSSDSVLDISFNVSWNYRDRAGELNKQIPIEIGNDGSHEFGGGQLLLWQFDPVEQGPEAEFKRALAERHYWVP